MHKIASSILLVLCTLGQKTIAQINESDTTSLQLRGLIGGSYQTGNVELTRISGQVDFSSTIRKSVVFKSQNNYLFQKIVGNKADDNYTGQHYLYLKPQQKVYPYAIGFVTTNFRRDIDLRVFGGLGVTYQLLRKLRHNIKISTNLLYEQSRFAFDTYNESKFNGSNLISAPWSTLYLRGYHSINNNMVYWIYEAYLQQSIEDNLNYRYHFYNGIDIKLIKNLFVQTRILYTYENVVVLGNEQHDLLWTWGMTYFIKK